MSIKGLIFDFDGVLIDTEMPWFMAWVELFAQYGFIFTMQDYAKTIGTDKSKYDPAQHLSLLTEEHITSQDAREIANKRTRELIVSQPLLPGVLTFLAAAQKRGLPMAIASSSSRSWVEGYLEQFGIRKHFSAVCTADDASKVKPDPELFLLAARKISVHPNEAIVFEDSPNGIKAAKAAGMVCIAIPNEFTRTLDLSDADKIVNSFEELEINDIFYRYTIGENDIL